MKQIIAGFAVLAFVACGPIFSSAENLTARTSATPSSSSVAQASNSVVVGPFGISVPAEWKAFSPAEAAVFRSQYMAQSAEIYRQFSGADDPAKSVDLAAYHISGDESAFVIVAFTVPPSANLIGLLKDQVGEKMAYGVREGFIRKYLGIESVDTGTMTGFYTKAVGRSGNIEVSGGLEHKSRKNTVVQLTLLCPPSWDAAKASATLSRLLSSVTLRD